MLNVKIPVDLTDFEYTDPNGYINIYYMRRIGAIYEFYDGYPRDIDSKMIFMCELSCDRTLRGYESKYEDDYEWKCIYEEKLKKDEFGVTIQPDEYDLFCKLMRNSE